MGYYRLYLSLLVVASHLWDVTLFKTGTQAVACFFVLSGFLMSHSVDITYGRSCVGIARYLTNRCLRIYPAYWLILGLSIFFLLMYPKDVFNLQMRLNFDPYVLFSNISLYNLYSMKNIFVPPAWSLTVEFIFYIFIGIIPLSYYKSIFGIFLSASLISFLVYFDFIKSLHTVLAYGALCFSAGCLANYIKIHISKPVFVVSLCVIPFLYYIFSACNIAIYPTIYIFGCILGLLCTLFLKDNQKKFSRKLEKFCGDLSYPVFLCYYLVAEVLTKFFKKFPIYISAYSFFHFFISLFFSLCLSIIIYIY